MLEPPVFSFPSCYFSVLGFIPGSHITCSFCVSLVYSNLWQFFVSWHSYWDLAADFVQCLLSFSEVFSWFNCGYILWGRIPQGKCYTLRALYQSIYMLSMSIIIGDRIFDDLVKIISAIFLHCPMTNFPFLIDKYLREDLLN